MAGRNSRSKPLTEVVATGDRAASLEAIRDRLAAALLEAEGREIAAIARELRAVLDALDKGTEARGSGSDDLAARREARRKAAGL